jgi:hypothetical protein
MLSVGRTSWHARVAWVAVIVHGLRDGDWTHGCIAVIGEEMDGIWEGTPIRVGD